MIKQKYFEKLQKRLAGPGFNAYVLNSGLARSFLAYN
jgi:hypothetical protein